MKYDGHQAMDEKQGKQLQPHTDACGQGLLDWAAIEVEDS